MKLLLFIVLTLSSALAPAQEAEFSFLRSTLKLAKAKEGETVRFQYEFTNSGKAPLLITAIKVQCACTTFEYPKDPIPPGEKGIIRVSFDTKGKIGYQDRILEVHSNARKSPHKLRFKITVDNS